MEEIEFINFIGTQIRKYRNSRGMSQIELSKKSNLHRTYISQIESGDKNPSIVSLLKICKALKIQFTDILPKEIK